MGIVFMAAVALLCTGAATAADTRTASTTIATGPVILDEQFSGSALDPAWTFVQVPGRGSYSLTGGSFRLIGEGFCTGQALSWWDPTWSHGWPEGSYLIRTFAGDRWVLRTSATYHLHGSTNGDSTGAQDPHIVIAFGDGAGPKLDIQRVVDHWYLVNFLGVHLQNAEGGDPMLFPDYVAPNTPINFRAADDVYHIIGNEGWIEHSYWYEVVRDGQQVTVGISTDGTTFTQIRSFTLPPATGATQRMALYFSEWAQVGSSVDWDMVTVHALEGTPTGSVTGGGWFGSPAGAYGPDPDVTGKATIGFVSKYRDGAGLPTGQLQFALPAAGFRFHASGYDRLVVAGTRAEVTGSGTVNGADGYAFALTAVDGAPDLLRMKIWDTATETMVYDSQAGSADGAAPTAALSAALSGGSIVVHR